MKLKILHLSDLHFTSNNISQDIVMSSLSKTIEELCKHESKPNLLVITGDIAFGGKADEYAKAKEFIDKIAQYCGISILVGENTNQRLNLHFLRKVGQHHRNLHNISILVGENTNQRLKADEYAKAKEFIDKIAQYCGISILVGENTNQRLKWLV